MRANPLSLLALSILPLACSGTPEEHILAAAGTSASAAAGGEDGTSDDSLFAPASLQVTPHPGGCGALELIALTLRTGPSNGELYAALKNEGSAPACSPAFSVQLFDETEQMLATGLAGLKVQRFYRLVDGSQNIAACVGPGDVSMVAITDLPADVALQDVTRVEYWCNLWALEVVAGDGIRIDDVRAVARDGGVAYTGVLRNDFDVPLSKPGVAVFPLNRAGRPLGLARGESALALPPGGHWEFETEAVSDGGVSFAAYAAEGP